jgi:5-methylcytosine-specific restriction protein B
MSEFAREREALWDSFLQRWPLEALPALTLQQYTDAGNEDCFVYWLEARTEELGSIWGGSAFKFGIYSRKDKTPKQNKGGLSYSDNYAWYTKYGTTPEMAFTTVRDKIVQVANAAHAGNLEAIGSMDLGRAFKWKIAFLYQNREDPVIIPVYSAEYLAAYLGQKSTDSIARLQRSLRAQRGSENVFTFAKTVWETAKTIIQQRQPDNASQELTVEQFRSALANTDLASHEDLTLLQTWRTMPDAQTTAAELATACGISSYTAINSKLGNLAKRIARFLNLDFKADADQDTFWVQLLADFQKGPGDLLWKMKPNLQRALDDEDSNENETSMIPSKASLNTILYGPPGTGKTHNTINEALRIIDPDFLAANIGKDMRAALKQRFDDLVADGRIRMVTFHQSFSYEDFVEGLSAITDDDKDSENDGKDIKYVIKPGIFKRLCDDARTRSVAPDVGIRANPRIWKISIDGTGSSPTKTYCLTHNEARIGWGNTGNLLLPLEGNDYYQSLGSGDKGTLRYFSEGISVGDILLCIHSAEQINAVGVVTGEYRYDSAVPSDVKPDYQHVRSVRWLCKDIKLPILPLNDNKSFTLKTVYQMDRFTWGDLLAYLEKNNIQTILPAVTSGNAMPHVLIIDEINRGNISRIFGELITLIEPSKREGADEALSLDLPYSKKPFSVPSSVYLIGTMNTADRSLAGLDIALRRRFTFKEMPPLPELLDDITVDNLNIGSLLRTMNQRIEVLLDRDHCLGHAYFLPLEKDNSLERLAFIFRQQILPLLQEYFFEDWERIAWILNDHSKPTENQFIQLSSINIGKLFAEKADLLKNTRRWQINEDAFNNLDSYRGILGAGA